MPQVNDLNRLRQEAAFDQLHRTLILVDTITGKSGWCKFVHNYDASTQGAVERYFESTLSTISAEGASKIFTANVLPILPHVGKWQVVIITRRPDGCTITNGVPGGVDQNLGVGG